MLIAYYFNKFELTWGNARPIENRLAFLCDSFITECSTISPDIVPFMNRISRLLAERVEKEVYSISQYTGISFFPLD